MFRTLRWPLLILFLILVGLWPAAAAPISLAATGASHILAAIPGSVLAAIAAIVWLRHRQTNPTPTTA
jgi:hypothetical protein